MNGFESFRPVRRCDTRRSWRLPGRRASRRRIPPRPTDRGRGARSEDGLDDWILTVTLPAAGGGGVALLGVAAAGAAAGVFPQLRGSANPRASRQNELKRNLLRKRDQDRRYV